MNNLYVMILLCSEVFGGTHSRGPVEKSWT